MNRGVFQLIALITFLLSCSEDVKLRRSKVSGRLVEFKEDLQENITGTGFTFEYSSDKLSSINNTPNTFSLSYEWQYVDTNLVSLSHRINGEIILELNFEYQGGVMINSTGSKLAIGRSSVGITKFFKWDGDKIVSVADSLTIYEYDPVQQMTVERRAADIWEYTYNGENISSIQLTNHDESSRSWQFEYDDRINPLIGSFLHFFPTNSPFDLLFIPKASSNNITSLKHTYRDSNGTIVPRYSYEATYTYEYSKNDYPVKVLISKNDLESNFNYYYQ